ncbi:MAG: alpha/beta hydrolase [bacterium]|nr:alpha/beta hydrolase [bacterium]MCP5069340.1 alpha/beta hydrolase [bacterium]
MKHTITKVRVLGQEIPVCEWLPEGGSTVLFLHGFGRHPAQYGMVHALARDHGFRVLAPFLYPNNALNEPPRSFRSCVALTRAVVRELEREGNLQAGYGVVGHSTGGSVAQCLADSTPRPNAILALNPVFPVKYGPWGFVARSACITGNQLLGRTGPAYRGWALTLRYGGKMLANLARKFEATWALASNLSRLQLQEYRLLYDSWGQRGVRFGVPTAVFQAERDEFFRVPDNLRAWMGLVFEHFELRQLQDVRGHEWPLMRPELAAQKVSTWLAAQARAESTASPFRPPEYLTA